MGDFTKNEESKLFARKARIDNLIKENENEQKKPEDNTIKEAEISQEKITELEIKIEELSKKVLDLQYALAERENIIRRMHTDIALEAEKALRKFITENSAALSELLIVLSNEKHQALEMIFNKFIKSLEASKIEVIYPKPGDDFDSQIHNAIVQNKNLKYENGKIDKLIATGYSVHGKVVTHAMVSIVNND